jgi:hypothetical protein
MGWARLMGSKNEPTKCFISEFPSRFEVLFFVGIFVPLIESKNYEIRRVAKEFRDERFDF